MQKKLANLINNCLYYRHYYLMEINQKMISIQKHSKISKLLVNNKLMNQSQITFKKLYKTLNLK